MASIEVRCQTCGERLVLEPSQVTTFSGPSDPPQPSGFSYDCPFCGETSVRPLDARRLSLLRAAGVRLPGDPPRQERGHPEHPPPGPPLTRDDLLDLHLLLAADRWFERLSSGADTSA